YRAAHTDRHDKAVERMAVQCTRTLYPYTVRSPQIARDEYSPKREVISHHITSLQFISMRQQPFEEYAPNTLNIPENFFTGSSPALRAGRPWERGSCGSRRSPPLPRPLTPPHPPKK